MLLLTSGTSQVYYGDESARDLIIEGTVGDATLRSFMNWDDIQSDDKTRRVLQHWQKLGQFRNNHMAVGAGKHQLISEENGLVFSRTKNNDKVIIGIEIPKGDKKINVSSVFKNGETITDFYSKQLIKVIDGTIQFSSKFDICLLEN